ncbi:MAG: isopentenyl-diphosphate Delta-isomerase, partial [Chitinophagaceae bacterium]|nr:isopentenyl-diphosphate Delta-isomerase [Chitinophagaceae bacterium]
MNSAEQEKVILVNEQDEWMGLADKMQAHKDGLLHRAFSVFVFNSNNELLIQQRADHKYHSPGLWSNTCCSHPRKGESTYAAAHRRLKEELGFDCDIEKAFAFRYKADVGNGLIENEYDHIYTGYTDKVPNINPDEVKDYEFVPVNTLLQRVEEDPQ